MSPRPENYPIPEHWSERIKDIHKLTKEFRDHLTTEKYVPPTETEGVVVLSAPPEKRNEEVVEKTSENIARIEYGIEMIKQIVAKKSKKSIEEITNEDIIEYAPPLILNGETEQLPAMKEITLASDFPEEKIQLVNCGDRGIGNTKTQFEQMNNDPRFMDIKHLTYITTSYHVPRVVRTADKNLKQDINFEIIGVPLEDFQYNVYRKVRGEIKRILAYSEKGDMKRFIKEPAFPLVEFGKNIDEIEINHLNEEVLLSEKAVQLRKQLEESLKQKKVKGEPVPFNGELANVDNFRIEDDKILLNTSKTDYYSYLASSYTHRDNHQENPVRPLAVSVTLLTPDGEILFEKRTGLTEMGDKYHVFGGSLKPGEDPKAAIVDRLKNKLKLELNLEDIQLSGADLENLQNILEIFFVVKLKPGQVEELIKNMPKKEIHKIPAKKELKQIEKMFHEKDITDWNPSGFYNVMYALIKLGYRTPEEIKAIVEPLQKKISRKPYRYKYPIEEYLK